MNIKIGATKFQHVSEVTIPDVYYRRLKCGNEKIDAAFGGGILPGSSITLTARAGMGKTTFVLQLLELLNNNGHKVGYCSSEESVAQLAMACKRLQVKNIQVCNESDVDTISKYMEDMDVIVVDSFQGLVKGNKRGRELEKYCIEKLVVRAKETECAIILICHNTKAGGIKGSSLIIHAVDVNVSIHLIKDADMNARAIRFDKNRFGPATDIECFIEYSGYDFDKEVIVEDTGKKNKVSKADKKREQRDAI
ncbi:hypothetical protein EBU95_19630, partial [bacterium]|nr:hypothetical protein [bacterium]